MIIDIIATCEPDPICVWKCDTCGAQRTGPLSEILASHDPVHVSQDRFTIDMADWLGLVATRQ